MVANCISLCYTNTRQEVKTLKNEITFTAKQVGERVKERRTELNLTMPELGKRIGVNKSTKKNMKQAELTREEL